MGFIEELSLVVEEIMGRDFVHGYPHIIRVQKYAEKIIDGENLDVDRLLLKTAILLHDIGRVLGEPHAYYSAVFARGYLSSKNLSGEFIDKVVNAILYHSYSYSRKHGAKPASIEALVLSDADKLDALGIIGFTRVIGYSAQIGRSLVESVRHIDDKILRLDKLLYFETSKKIANRLMERTRYVRDKLFEELLDLGLIKRY